MLHYVAFLPMVWDPNCNSSATPPTERYCDILKGWDQSNQSHPPPSTHITFQSGCPAHGPLFWELLHMGLYRTHNPTFMMKVRNTHGYFVGCTRPTPLPWQIYLSGGILLECNLANLKALYHYGRAYSSCFNGLGRL
jgi:hypothetical protein